MSLRLLRQLAVSAMIWRHVAAVLALAALVVFLALPHLSGDAVFIGDSDRLNTFLNIKLSEVIGLKEQGEIAAWNPNSFMGFNMLGLYWTLPGWQPDAYIHALFPIENFVRNAGFVTFGLLFFAMCFAYAYLYSITGRCLAATVGACTYGFSALSLGRLAQVDTAYYTIALLPLAMLMVKGLGGSRWRVSGVILSLCMATMLGMAFLQETAYVLVLLGAYTLHVAAKDRGWRPIIVFVMAFFGALFIAGPRLYAVAEEFSLMFRTSVPSGTTAIEGLRLFHDGIFGRTFQEAWEVIGNRGFNGHEGVQLYSSTIATCLVLLAVFLINVRRHISSIVIFYFIFSVIAYYILRPLGVVAFLGCIAVLIFRLRSVRSKNAVVSIDSGDAFAFHFVTVAAVLALVLVPPARHLLYLLFLKVDFLHARVIIVALLPFAAVVTMMLAGIDRGQERSVKPSKPMIVIAFLVGAAAIVAWHYSVFVWYDGLPLDERKIVFRDLNLHRGVVWQALGIIAVVFSVLIMFAKTAKFPNVGRQMLYVAFGSAIITEGFLYAQERFFGEPTRSFPIAFRSYNYFTAPGGTFSVPSASCREQLGNQLESNTYRSVSLGDPAHYFAFTGPHLSQFWQLRLLDGYPGLPKRLAELPWPPGIANLRSLTFRQADALPWELLGILGVKYAVLVSDNLYFNSFEMTSSGHDCGAATEVKVLKNPFPVLPRYYFAESAQVLKNDQNIPEISGINIRIVAQGQLELEWWSPMRDGAIEVQLRSKKESTFQAVGHIPPINDGRLRVGGILEGGEYVFRLRKLDAKGRENFVSDELDVFVPKISGAAPKITEISRGDRGKSYVTWVKNPGAINMKVEVRHGIDGEFMPVAEVPASDGGAWVPLNEPVQANAVRIQSTFSSGVSPHSDTVLLGKTSESFGLLVRKMFGEDPRLSVSVEGAVADRRYATDGLIHAIYHLGGVTLNFEASEHERFLVVNEMFHPRWRATVAEKELTIFPTNHVMLGTQVPSGARQVELEFLPVLKNSWAPMSLVAGFLIVFSIAIPFNNIRANARAFGRGRLDG